MPRYFLLLLAWVAVPAFSADIIELSVERVDQRIEIYSDIRIEAPQALVFAALTDYDGFARLSDRYVESRYIEPAADGTPRIFTHVKGCVLFFCRSVKRYARLEQQPDTRIVATVEPEQSDVRYGQERWELSPAAKGTRVVYRHEMEPRFWVPPLIGLWAIRRALEQDAGKAAARIEALAQGEQ